MQKKFYFSVDILRNVDYYLVINQRNAEYNTSYIFLHTESAKRGFI